ncbi:hypothetical protein NM208_g10431 [Fusarium decemcellulare]|uniref:Uncharacterized protein n=1 Tax=Fusarium decemcellulare TaxID=57161 RepID=A0ACC1RY00_9HYPO|nr:hypothetical protein NM208_g10431 [Fusarium decemcellulare]
MASAIAVALRGYANKAGMKRWIDNFPVMLDPAYKLLFADSIAADQLGAIRKGGFPREPPHLSSPNCRGRRRLTAKLSLPGQSQRASYLLVPGLQGSSRVTRFQRRERFHLKLDARTVWDLRFGPAGGCASICCERAINHHQEGVCDASSSRVKTSSIKLEELELESVRTVTAILRFYPPFCAHLGMVAGENCNIPCNLGPSAPERTVDIPEHWRGPVSEHPSIRQLPPSTLPPIFLCVLLRDLRVRKRRAIERVRLVYEIGNSLLQVHVVV